MPTATDPRSEILSAVHLTPHDLAEQGVTRHRTGRLVSTGHLVRLRNGRYATPAHHPDLLNAGSLGGRLDCVSLLATLGVFVRERRGLHVQFTHSTTRLPARPTWVTAHWRQSRRERNYLAADVIEALAQACRCQSPRDAVATLDSAWHAGLVDEEGIAGVFRLLPKRYRVLRSLLDHRSESGTETLVRLMLRAMGAHVKIQVTIRGVGRVDFVVDGWLIIECDSRAHHEGWAAQKRDRRRDLAAAALGYTTIRPIAEDILENPSELQQTLVRVLAHRSHPTSAKLHG